MSDKNTLTKIKESVVNFIVFYYAVLTDNIIIDYLKSFKNKVITIVIKSLILLTKYVLAIISSVVKGYKYIKTSMSESKSITTILTDYYVSIKTQINTGYTISIQVLSNIKNIIVIKSYDIVVYSKNKLVSGVYKLYNGIIYLKNTAYKSIIYIYHKGVNLYYWVGEKTIAIGLFVITVGYSLVNYIKFSQFVLITVVKNTSSYITESFEQARESDESFTKKQYIKLVRSIDKFSYTLLKTISVLMLGKNYRDPLFVKQETRFPQIQEWLNQANKKQTAEEYLARSLIFGIGLWVIGVFFGSILGSFISQQLQGASLPISYQVIPEPVLLFLANNGILIGSIVGGIVLGFLLSSLSVISAYIYAWYLARDSRRQIELYYNNAISYMYSLAKGGADIDIIIEKMANSEETTGQVAVEFKKIQDIIKYEREDITSALQKQSERTPSAKMGSLLSDLQVIQESGTSAEDILESKHNEVLLEKQNNAENVETTVELFNEIILNIGLLPVFLIILFIVQSLQGTPPMNEMYFVTYGMWLVILILGGGGAWLLLQDESEPDKTITTGRSFYESHLNIQKIPSIIEEELKTKTRNTNHITDTKIENVLDQIYKSEYRSQKIIQPAINVKERPLAMLPYSIILVLLYGMVIYYTGIPIPESFEFVTSNPYEFYIYYVYAPLIILLGPVIAANDFKMKKITKVEAKIESILNKGINSMKTGGSFDDALQKTYTDNKSSMIPFINNSAEEIDHILEQTWNNIKWKHDRENSLREMANAFKTPKMTRTMKIITDSYEYTSNIIPVLEIEKRLIEKEKEAQSIINNAGTMSAAISIVAVLLISGVLITLDVAFLDSLSGMAEGTGDMANTQGGGQMGFNSEMFSLFPALFMHTSVNVAFAFGVFSGKMTKDSFIVGLKYGLILSILVFALFGGVELFV